MGGRVDTSTRYVEYRRDGADPVGTLCARRIPLQLLDWVETQAASRRTTQRAVIEDALRAFIRFRQGGGRVDYPALPKTGGRMKRMFVSLGLLSETLDLVQRDSVFNGDVVAAALRMARDRAY